MVGRLSLGGRRRRARLGNNARIRADYDKPESGSASASGARRNATPSRLAGPASRSCCAAFRVSLRTASRAARASRDGRQSYNGRPSRRPRNGARIRPLFDRFRFRQVSWAPLGQSLQVARIDVGRLAQADAGYLRRFDLVKVAPWAQSFSRSDCHVGNGGSNCPKRGKC